MNKTEKSTGLFQRATKVMPGGVNSPVRAFKSVGRDPLFIKSAKGAYLYDEDDNKYIELINSWGPMILGHGHEEVEREVLNAVKNSLSFGTPTAKEVEIAELIKELVPSVEKVRLVNSGTEATMSAVRLARGYTGKDKILKFEGNYHGHGDSFLIAAGSGAATYGVPNSPGVTEGTVKDTLTAPYNDLEKVEEAVQQNKGQVAAIIVEPVAGNMGCVLPKEGFLQGLREICDRENIILIFDEVMTGFRLSLGGAQERFGIRPDMTAFGKIIGGGMPVGAFGGKEEIMNKLSPEGPVYQSGTLSGNPVTVAAGAATLSHLKNHPEIYHDLEEKGKKLAEGLKANVEKAGFNFQVNQIGSMVSLFFTDQDVYNLDTAKTSDTEQFATYFRSMLNKGVHLAPSQFEALFISIALNDDHIHHILNANYETLTELNN